MAGIEYMVIENLAPELTMYEMLTEHPAIIDNPTRALNKYWGLTEFPEDWEEENHYELSFPDFLAYYINNLSGRKIGNAIINVQLRVRAFYPSEIKDRQIDYDSI
jgi:hypothetical protein